MTTDPGPRAPAHPEPLDSRRLTGPNVLWDRPGAVLDVALSPEEAEVMVPLWEREARARLDAVGWDAETTAVQRTRDGARLALSAPLDALYAACELNERAWAAALASAAGESARAADDDAPELRALIDAERRPLLAPLSRTAREHGVTVLVDEDEISVGLGTGSRTWPADALPEVDAVDWGSIHDVPIALVTGTNGKSTTVRLLAGVVRAARRVPGLSTTDWIKVGDEVLDHGDYSGPGGARTVLRDRRTEVALLETARGGLLRRGCAVTDADVAIVTNVAADHMGEYSIHTLDDLAAVKLVVARVARMLVLNAEDEATRAFVRRWPGADASRLPARSPRGAPITWTAVDGGRAELAAHGERGGTAAVLDDGVLCRVEGARRTPIVALSDVPVTLGGAAGHNVANALAVVAAAPALGVPDDALARGLAAFTTDAEDNPGRGNVHRFGDATVLVDFAHNPHGHHALNETAVALAPRRFGVLLGQAGDRDDASIRELVRVGWQPQPDHVFIKDMPENLRGREPGEVPALIEAELRTLGAPEHAWSRHPDEMAAVRAGLAWLAPGDLLLLLVHARRADVLALLEGLAAAGWAPGDALPD